MNIFIPLLYERIQSYPSNRLYHTYELISFVTRQISFIEDLILNCAGIETLLNHTGTIYKTYQRYSVVINDRHSQSIYICTPLNSVSIQCILSKIYELRVIITHGLIEWNKSDLINPVINYQNYIIFVYQLSRDINTCCIYIANYIPKYISITFTP